MTGVRKIKTRSKRQGKREEIHTLLGTLKFNAKRSGKSGHTTKKPLGKKHARTFRLGHDSTLDDQRFYKKNMLFI